MTVAVTKLYDVVIRIDLTPRQSKRNRDESSITEPIRITRVWKIYVHDNNSIGIN